MKQVEGRLVSDTLEVTDVFKSIGFLLTIDIIKVFHYLKDLLKFNMLTKKLGFGKNF